MSARGKTLEYQAEEPSFLKKLRAQQAGRDVDRHERPLARPRRAKAAGGDEDDDAPTYVDGATNNTVSKEEYEALLEDTTTCEGQTATLNKQQAHNVIVTADSGSGDSVVVSVEKDTVRPKQELTEAGKLQKKRKAIKILGEEQHEDSNAQAQEAVKKQKKKKSKAVALSFNGDDR